MNSSNSNYDGHPLDYTINGYRFFIGIAAGVIMLIVTIVVSSLYCTRVPNPPRQNNDTADHDDHNHPAGDIEIGLDEAILESYPKFQYSEAKIQTKHTTADSSCCSICLADYNNTDITRLLLDCRHFFHQMCIDPWLLKHPTCPVCRASPLPTPQMTPMSNVMPPARNIN
ncbi:hypothetical protein C5167_021746 [Papaver somniferum]|uniref:RING-type domain-containing protein n=1 Tax=Papaver somniferum TaxID=3469 RepID=A0A4Y7JIW3_PAPSO|nr:RING-H2 finger protein ATL70-like [Papaver somniferum]RZC59990.1 hypothetical protein C5167_021746 [Papaver somniferum]